MARQRGKKWQGDVFIDGQRVRRSFDTPHEAEQFERCPLDFIAYDGTQWTPLEYGAPEGSVRWFGEKYFARIWGQNSDVAFARRHFENVCAAFGPRTRLIEIKTLQVDQAIAAWLAKGFSAASINHRLSALSKLLVYAKRHGLISDLPYIERLKLDNAREKIWSKQDEFKAFEFLRDLGDERVLYILQFLLYTGARVGEAYKLKRIYVCDGWIRFDKSTTKNGKTREIPLSPKAADAWDNLCRLSSYECPFDVITERSLRHRWQLLREHFGATDDPEFVIHMLRHTCASRLVAARVPIAHVMQWMGHRSINATMRYSHIAPRELEYLGDILS